MATLGNKAPTSHVSLEKQTITGNGGTSYSLQQSVGSALDIAVFVNNTRQEPTTAYSASGTTLTMTGAVNASDHFYVIFLGKAITTTGLPVDAVAPANINASAITEAKIANTAVTNAKIANSTIDLTSKVTGVLPTARGGTGDTAGSAMVLLNTTTISGATANVTFENLFDDAYATFIIRGTNITSNAGSDQDDFVAYKARGGSSTYDTDATYGTKINTTSNANSNYTVNGGFSETKWEMTPSGHLDATEAVPLQFEMTLPDPKGTTGGGRAFNYFLTYYSYHPYYITSHGTLWSTNGNVTGIKFQFSTNSILTGTFKLYGIK